MSNTALHTKRALGVVRLSVGSVGQTGDDTQRRRISKRIDADEASFVGFAEDIDVSASLSPWLRPSLGDWLNNRKDEFDVLYVYKIDRIARSVKDLCALLDWCDQHNKSLISIEEGFDLNTVWGRMIAKILAVLAEAELESIKARIRASREAMREAGRWAGGLVPFGRVAVKDGDGYTLALCPEYGPILLEMIRLFIACKSFAVVADWLNTGNVPTVQDIARMRAAAGTSTTRLNEEKAKPRGAKWSATAVVSILSSRSLLGEYVRADGTVVRNPDGTPVMRSEPVLTEEEWTVLQEVMSTVQYTKGPSQVSAVRGFLFCDGSDYTHPLYWARGGKKSSKPHRIRCQGHRPTLRKPCPGHSWNAERLYALLGATFKAQLAGQPVKEKRLSVDDSRAVKVAVLDGRMTQLEAEFKAGRLSAVAYATQLGEVAAERETLTNAPAATAVESWQPVIAHAGDCPGGACECPPLTYGVWWDNATRDERREKLIMWGVKVFAGEDGVRFEYGDGFPARPFVSSIGFHSDPPPADVVQVVDLTTKTIDVTDTRTGEVTTIPLLWGDWVSLAA